MYADSKLRYFYIFTLPLVPLSVIFTLFSIYNNAAYKVKTLYAALRFYDNRHFLSLEMPLLQVYMRHLYVFMQEHGGALFETFRRLCREVLHSPLGAAMPRHLGMSVQIVLQ